MISGYLVVLQIDDDVVVRNEWFDSRSDGRDYFDAMRATLDYLNEADMLALASGGISHTIYLLLVRGYEDKDPEEWPILSKAEYTIE